MKNYIYVLLLLIPSISWADTYVVAIEGMHCKSCAESITKNLNSTFEKDKIQNVNVDFATKQAKFSANKIEEDKIKQAIESLGFKVTSIHAKTP